MSPSPLTILFRDRWLVAVDKPAGQLVHPADVPQPGDEVTMKILRDQLGRRVQPVHRLDRPTCGVLLFAIERDAERAMRRAFDTGRVRKTYWAVVDGQPGDVGHAWRCEEPLRKTEGAPSREAVTEFEVVRLLSGGLSLVEARPLTGRFHQIRRHLLHARAPIVGDYLYSGADRSDALGTMLGTGTRMLLQARQLELDHPADGQRLTITAPVDPQLSAACNKSAEK